jgi:quercetin dioxygenase-like cupin family protein
MPAQIQSDIANKLRTMAFPILDSQVYTALRKMLMYSGGNVMQNVNRRHALILGAALASPLALASTSAKAAMYGADAGKEILPGVRQVDLGKWQVGLPTYKTVVITDYIVAPGSGFPSEAMKNDMICHILEGEFQVKQGDKEFTSKAGDVFVCVKDQTEEDKNTGQVDAVMRVIDLMTM